MDAWMDEPGARVEGHRAVVRGRGPGAQASCSCGHVSAEQRSVQGACLNLVQHLELAVRNGARVVREGGGGGDGSAGVREPRRPGPSSGGGSVQLDIA